MKWSEVKHELRELHRLYLCTIPIPPEVKTDFVMIPERLKTSRYVQTFNCLLKLSRKFRSHENSTNPNDEGLSAVIPLARQLLPLSNDTDTVKYLGGFLTTRTTRWMLINYDAFAGSRKEIKGYASTFGWKPFREPDVILYGLSSVSKPLCPPQNPTYIQRDKKTTR